MGANIGMGMDFAKSPGSVNVSTVQIYSRQYNILRFIEALFHPVVSSPLDIF